MTNPDWASAYCLASIDGVTPPTERLIFPRGDFKTTKGTFVFDDEAAKLVMADWLEWTGGLPDKGAADYEHDQSKDYIPGQDKLDSASFDLEVIQGALWATNIKWTARAAAMIANREKRFTSPWWLYERGSKRIIRFINFGLVSLPATLGQKELMAASKAPNSAMVQIPADAFAGYFETSQAMPERPVASAQAGTNPDPAESTPPKSTPAAETASSSPSEPPPVIETAAAPEAPIQEKAAQMSQSYKDPNFQATRHGYALRYMASMAMDEMMTAIHLHSEVPMLSAAMNLSAVCTSQAELVMHCAGAMAECVTAADADMDDDTEVDASLAALIEKLPAELKTKINSAVASCKAAKIGGLVQKAHKEALAAAGAERFGKGAFSSIAEITASKPILAAVATITGEKDSARASAALAALQQDIPELRKRAEEATAAAAKATEAKEAAEKTADSVKYESLMTANKAKMPGKTDEEWVRANIKTADALDAYFKSKKTVSTLATNYEQSATTSNAQAAATAAAQDPVLAAQAAKDREALIESVELDAQELAGWVTTGGGDDRLKNLKEKKARKLGLIV